MKLALLDRWRQAPLITSLQVILAFVLIRLLMEFGGGFVDGMIAGFTD